MSVTISLIVNVQIPGGPKVSSTQTLDVAGYDSNEYVIPHGGADHTVDVQPSDASHVKLLLISADHYADTLTYKVKDETGTGTHPVKLDTQQLLVGAGAMSLLEKAPKQLVFNNGGAADATVQILVGRSA